MMLGKALITAIALICGVSTSALAQERAGPAGPCVNAVFDDMSGIWGPDTPEFSPYNIPATAWQVFRNDHEIMLQLESGNTNVWFLTEHGADFVRQTGRGQYEGVYISLELLTCREAADGQPGVIESLISEGPQRQRFRQRFEILDDRLTITRFDPSSGEVVSQQLMRGYQPPPAPMPPPPRR